MNLRSILILKTWKALNLICWFCLFLLIQLILPNHGFGRIFIDITSPSIPKINIAIPDFKNFSNSKEHPELSTLMPEVISNDLDLSGYFHPMDKNAFLDEDGPLLTRDNIRFKNWTVIGAELLLKGGYTSIGRSVEVEVRLYDLFRGRQILGKKFLGKIGQYRPLMHRIGNEVISVLTGYKGLFLTKLAFVGTSTGHKEIYVSDYDGHNVKQITSDRSIALLPRWSPLGDSLIYNSFKEGGPMLYIKYFSKGKVRRISGRKGLNTGASWSSDGKKLALTLSYKGNPDIFAIDLNGKVIDRFTNHWGIDVSPTFSPDGSKIAFVSNRSGSPQIYIKDLAQKKKERLSYEGKYNTSPSWSRLNRIAFSGINDGHFNIYTINPNGSDLRRLTDNQGNNEDPSWSPDGRYIVFSSNRDGGYHLFIMNANGQNQRRITFQKGEQTAPSWSPN